MCVFAAFYRPMGRSRCTQNGRSSQFRVWWAYARRACDAKMVFFLYGRRRQEQQGQRLPSAELGRRQAAGVLWLEARPAWALATRVKKRAEKPLHFASNARVFALMKH